MTTLAYYENGLLNPISEQQPSGADLRNDRLFADIAEARRADEELNEGVWQKASGRKLAEWDRVAELCLSALRDRTKDLRLCCYLTEAALRLDGFAGLRDCLRLTADVLEGFWDKGLFPAAEDGDLDYRAGSLVWLNDRMPDVMGSISLTARSAGENYGFSRYQQAQRVGTEAAIASVSGDKRETLQALIRQGWITMDTFDAALRSTKLEALEAIHKPFEEALQALTNLENIANKRFGPAAPTFTDVKEAFVSIQRVLASELNRRRAEKEQHKAPALKETATPSALPQADEANAVHADGWAKADALIRAGQIDQGLAEMAALAAQETSGRGRFLRKLTLADVCIGNGRERLGRAVLEELNRQIEEFKLDRWESSGLVCAVWSRLYKLCRKGEDTDDRNKAVQLYDQLCRLDPWQTYVSCED